MSQLHFIKQGQGPVVVLSHALGCDLQMWDSVAEILQAHYTVLRYDHRGQGRSPAVPGPFGLNELADDVAELIEREVGGPVHFVGLSMGGMTAQALAARHPTLVQKLVIANSASRYDAAAQVGWAARIDTVLAQGVESIADGAMQRWFTPEFRAAEPARVAALRAVLVATDPVAYADACAAVAAIDLDESNRRIACPVLIIAGTQDEATPLAQSEKIAGDIAGAKLVTIEAAHLSAVEKPAEFAGLVSDFLASL